MVHPHLNEILTKLQAAFGQQTVVEIQFSESADAVVAGEVEANKKG